MSPNLRSGKPVVTTVLLAALLALATSPALACPSAPQPVRDLDIPRYYTDAAGTNVDPTLKSRNEAAVAPLVVFLRHVAGQADAALKSAKSEKRQAAAQCALAWLEAWAKAGAWLGPRITQQGEYQRKWDLAGAALAYLKVKRFASPSQRRQVEAWLLQVAHEARRFFDDPARKRNNHWYWLGLALGATALASDDEPTWRQARGIMADAARDIAADGSLPMELDRGPRALHYHAFAVMPLVVLAELARSRGEDWYALAGGALHRLASLTQRGLAAPDVFEKLTTAPQMLRAGSAGAGWQQLYKTRFPERSADVGIMMPASHRWIGGDATLLIGVLGAAGSKPTD